MPPCDKRCDSRAREHQRLDTFDFVYQTFIYNILSLFLASFVPFSCMGRLATFVEETMIRSVLHARRVDDLVDHFPSMFSQNSYVHFRFRIFAIPSAFASGKKKRQSQHHCGNIVVVQRSLFVIKCAIVEWIDFFFLSSSSIFLQQSLVYSA